MLIARTHDHVGVAAGDWRFGARLISLMVYLLAHRCLKTR